MLSTVIAAVAAGIVAVTAAITAREYRNLPDRVPMHFALDGTPTTYQPRPMVWLIVAVQIFSGLIFSNTVTVLGQSRGPATALGAGIFGICVLGTLALAQFMIVSSAKSPDQRAPVGRFLISAGTLIALGILSMRLF